MLRFLRKNFVPKKSVSFVSLSKRKKKKSYKNNIEINFLNFRFCFYVFFFKKINTKMGLFVSITCFVFVWKKASCRFSFVNTNFVLLYTFLSFRYQISSISKALLSKIGCPIFTLKQKMRKYLFSQNLYFVLNF